MLQKQSEYITAREQMEWEREDRLLKEAQAHELKLKDIEVEVLKMEAKWSALLRLPIMLIKLPLLIVLGIGVCIAVARKHEPSDNFWRLFK